MQEQPKKPLKLFIATPAYGHSVTTSFANSVFKFMATPPDKDLPYHTMIHLQSGMALVTQARNNCVSEFMKSEAEFLLFIDSDIGFKPENIKKILRRCNETKCVVLAPYCVKGYHSVTNGVTFIIHFPDKNNVQIDKEGFCACKAGPTGFMMIHRSVFEKLAKAYPEKKTHNRQMVGDSVQNMDEFWYTFLKQMLILLMVI